MLELKYEFIASKEDKECLPNPVPASKVVPDWYKKMPRARDGDTYEPRKNIYEVVKGHGGLQGGPTLKECIPVRDYLTSGYVVPLWADLLVQITEGQPYFAWSHADTLSINHHPVFQVLDTPLQDSKKVSQAIPKLISPWGFKTPKGYSSFFFSPRYSGCKLEIFPAIVDTDTFHEINFPFIYHGEEGVQDMVARGTPIIQVIPFKRETWKSNVVVGDYAQTKEFRSFLYGVYRKLYHRKKGFR